VCAEGKTASAMRSRGRRVSRRCAYGKSCRTREQGGGGLDGTADVGRREVSTPSLPGAWACDNVRACAEKIVGNATGCASSLLLAGPLGLPPRVKAMRVRTMLSAVRCAAPRRQGHRGGADLCVFAQPTRNPTPHVPPGVRRARRVQPVQ
jgi:hypothetical protein